MKVTKWEEKIFKNFVNPFSNIVTYDKYMCGGKIRDLKDSKDF